MRDDSGKLRVAAYIRMEPDTDDHTDAKRQKAYYAQYIRANKTWRLAGLYADIRAADDTNRPALYELRERCKQGETDLIIVRSFRRLYADVADVLDFSAYVYKLGVDMIFQNERLQLSKLGNEGLEMLRALAIINREEDENHENNN